MSRRVDAVQLRGPVEPWRHGARLVAATGDPVRRHGGGDIVPHRNRELGLSPGLGDHSRIERDAFEGMVEGLARHAENGRHRPQRGDEIGEGAVAGASAPRSGDPANAIEAVSARMAPACAQSRKPPKGAARGAVRFEP